MSTRVPLNCPACGREISEGLVRACEEARRDGLERPLARRRVPGVQRRSQRPLLHANLDKQTPFHPNMFFFGADSFSDWFPLRKFSHQKRQNGVRA